MEEQQLILDLQNGNEQAFKSLWEIYANKLFNTVINIVQDFETAEDVVQETFIQVYNSIKDFKGNSSLSTWMHSIAIRKSIDVLRKEKNKSILKKVIPLYSFQNNKDAQFQHPGAQLEQKESTALLFKAVAQLPEKQRLTFTLIKIQELSYKEASVILNESVKALESLVVRAKKNLQQYLYEYYKS